VCNSSEKWSGLLGRHDTGGTPGDLEHPEGSRARGTMWLLRERKLSLKYRMMEGVAGTLGRRE
jgi:hypothetical protein